MEEQESNEDSDSVENSVNVTLYKIILVGDAAVGKTSIIQRTIHNKFSETYKNTDGVDFENKKINKNINSNNIK